MAEFQEVMRQWGRLCKYEREAYEAHDCEHCLMGENRADICGQYPTDSAEVAEDIEDVVMSWAAEHPEPVYPTWAEYLMHTYQDVSYARILGETIPADIAQKLGIEPKEG